MTQSGTMWVGCVGSDYQRGLFQTVVHNMQVVQALVYVQRSSEVV